MEKVVSIIRLLLLFWVGIIRLLLFNPFKKSDHREKNDHKFRYTSCKLLGKLSVCESYTRRATCLQSVFFYL